MVEPDQLPPADGTRYQLAAEEELRLEVPFQKQRTCVLTLQHGSCELWGMELTLRKPHVLTEGGLKIALFSWHGCVIDVDCQGVDIAYTTDETSCNVAFVNTHAQLEALRDQAAAAIASAKNGTTNNSTKNANATTTTNDTGNGSTNNPICDGPRVLVCGPAECGKSTLCKILTAYACKLGRTPILVDLDPQDSGLISVPGTLGACPMSLNSMSIDSYATGTGVVPPGTASPLLFWHGQDPQTLNQSSSSTSSSSKTIQTGSGSGGSSGVKALPLSPELFRTQVQRLAQKIDQRLSSGDDLARTSGLIVNTNGWIENEGFDLLVFAIRTLRIHVVLVLGHDRLYSMLKSTLSKPDENEQQQQASSAPKNQAPATKVIKLPRSGGVVSRGTDYIRRLRNRSIKQYFYGSLIERPNTSTSNTESSASPSTRVPQLTPFLVQLPIDQVTIYKFSSVRLSASLLPVAAAQTSEAIQLVPVIQNGKVGDFGGGIGIGGGGGDADDEERTKQQLLHHMLAVCHRSSVQAYEASGQASDLYLSGVAGFCTIERIVLDKLHLLSPCAGSLPSNVLLMGNIMWME